MLQLKSIFFRMNNRSNPDRIIPVWSLTILVCMVMLTNISLKGQEIQQVREVVRGARKEIELINPFTFDVDPMQRLILINIEKDPDSVYVGFEPQVFDDTINGTGHQVIGWRKDGRVDVYHQAGLHPDPWKFSIAGKGLSSMLKSEFEVAIYKVTENGVRVHYRFRDLYGREIILNILERNPSKRKPFGLLAPMGAAAETPEALPLVILHDFYFVRQKKTDWEVSVDGRKHKPDKLPILMDGKRMYFTRYSPDPLIVTFNQAHSGAIPVLHIASGISAFVVGETSISVVWEGEKPMISGVTRKHHDRSVQITFDPPFPSLLSMAEGATEIGLFTISGDESIGTVEGYYGVMKIDGGVEMNMVPYGGWKPRPDRLSLRFLYAVASVFRKWPSTYEWTGIITWDEDQRAHMQSAWKRI
jgi:hypothetical protein